MLSATENAPKNVEELKELLQHDTKVKVAIIDVDGVLRGKIMAKDKFISAAKDGFGFCGVVFGWDIQDAAYSPELLVSNKSTGHRDLLATIDLETFRRLPWERNIPLFLARLSMFDGSRLDPDPRTLLKSVLDAVEAQGWQAMSGAEFEYFQFSETMKSLKQKGYTGLDSLTPGMHGYSMIRTQANVDYFHDLYDQAQAMGIDIECHHTETGPGVYESALAYTDAGRMADNAVLFKLVAKSVGVQYGIMPTFMAKPYSLLPGCSGHIHVSLRSASGENIFAAKTPREGDDAGDLKYFSQEAEWFLGGLLEGLPDIVPMLCPNINSYKRLLGGEAMYAPDTASYGYESRSASVRLIGPPLAGKSAARFEVRVPGADMNTHYAIAAIYALGLRGIRKQIAVTAKPYGQPGSTYAELPKLPTSLESATALFKRKDSLAREVFGDFFVDHFAGTREHECEVHRRAVTAWEVERYFELA